MSQSICVIGVICGFLFAAAQTFSIRKHMAARKEDFSLVCDVSQSICGIGVICGLLLAAAQTFSTRKHMVAGKEDFSLVRDVSVHLWHRRNLRISIRCRAGSV
jgi:hypothetical protein